MLPRGLSFPHNQPDSEHLDQRGALRLRSAARADRLGSERVLLDGASIRARQSSGAGKRARPVVDRRERRRAEALRVVYTVEPSIIQVILAEPKGLYLDDLSAFLYDTALLNDAAVLSSPEYDYEFNQYFWRRNGRPTRPKDRVAVSHVRHDSPFLIELLVGGGVFAVLQGLEHVWYTKHRWRQAKIDQETSEVDLALKKEELKLKQMQVEREQRELVAAKGDRPTLIVIDRFEPPIELPRQAGPQLQDEDSQAFYAQTVRRLQRSRLEIAEISSRPAEGDEVPPDRN